MGLLDTGEMMDKPLTPERFAQLAALIRSETFFGGLTRSTERQLVDYVETLQTEVKELKRQVNELIDGKPEYIPYDID